MDAQSSRVLLWGHPEFESVPRADGSWIAAVLGARYPVFKNPGSYSGRYGLPIALGRLAPSHRIAVLELAAQSDVTVLLEGETGTGKELVARALHRFGAHPDGPWVAVNCGAIPESLLESELFGHRKGSFTGAVRDHKGSIETARGGTILLDEIGEMPQPAQVRLLRVLQHREIERVGGTERIGVDIRIVAASHQNLSEMVEAGRFREDLYYRLNVVTVKVPPLRERKEDIIPLARHFIDKSASDIKKDLRGIDPGAVRTLNRHTWPGNIREL